MLINVITQTADRVAPPLINTSKYTLSPVTALSDKKRVYIKNLEVKFSSMLISYLVIYILTFPVSCIQHKL